MSDHQSDLIKYVPPKCEKCGCEIVNFNLMCVPCAVKQLRAALKKANDQAEHFEREWYLRGDEIEALKAQPVQSAVAVNEVLLSASKLALDCLEVLTFGAECSPHYSVVIIKLKAAIAAAEAEKAKGGSNATD